VLLKDYIPPPDVQQVVQLYRIVHFEFEAAATLPAKAYPPRPEHCLAFYPFDTEVASYSSSQRQEANHRVVLYGQFTEVTQRRIGHRFLVFQIIFQPGALHRLLGCPAGELTNEYLDASLLLGSQVGDITDQLAACGSYDAMLEVASAFVRQLLAKAKRNSTVADDAIRRFQQMATRWSIDQLASEACLSHRQLERVFYLHTGVSPKQYQQIARFDKAFRLRNSKPHYSWLRIAMACGYHDYQHLAKAYQQWTGLSPRQFHALDEQAPERHFGLHEGYYDEKHL
jgi:AraC-like DNA-binding protein